MFKEKDLNGPYYANNGIMMPLYPFLTILENKYPGYNISEMYTTPGMKFRSEKEVDDYLQKYAAKYTCIDPDPEEIKEAVEGVASGKYPNNTRDVINACKYLCKHMDECLPLIKKVTDCSWRYNLLHLSVGGGSISYMDIKSEVLSFSKDLIFRRNDIRHPCYKHSEIEMERIMDEMVKDRIIFIYIDQSYHDMIDPGDKI